MTDITLYLDLNERDEERLRNNMAPRFFFSSTNSTGTKPMDDEETKEKIKNLFNDIVQTRTIGTLTGHIINSDNS
jgi:hypothetical protein